VKALVFLYIMRYNYHILRRFITNYKLSVNFRGKGLTAL